MKRIILSFAFIGISTAIFASDDLEKKVTNAVETLAGKVCETRSSTATCESTGESMTVSCTKCADDAITAGILATICSSKSLEKVIVFMAPCE